jgi:predicted nucleotidyltransferase
MPGKYKVDFKLKHNNEEIKVEEIVTFEGFYAGIAEAGEEVLIKGKLERVENKNRNKIYFRIVIGSFEAKGKDYIKIFKD